MDIMKQHRSMEAGTELSGCELWDRMLAYFCTNFTLLIPGCIHFKLSIMYVAGEKKKKMVPLTLQSTTTYR